MKYFNVSLVHNTPLLILDTAISMPHGKDSKDIDHAKERMYRIINKMKHESVAEHINYTFLIRRIPRFVLQELVRHRIASYTVKSSRYTLGELKNEEVFEGRSYTRASKYVYLGFEAAVNNRTIASLNALQELVKRGMSNDIIKGCMPEAYLTDLVMTINMRSLKNFFNLRSGKGALREIHILADAIWGVIPEEHKFLLEESYHGKVEDE